MRSNGHPLGPFSCQPTRTRAAGVGTNLLAQPTPTPDLPPLISPKLIPSSRKPKDVWLHISPRLNEQPDATRHRNGSMAQ